MFELVFVNAHLWLCVTSYCPGRIAKAGMSHNIATLRVSNPQQFKHSRLKRVSLRSDGVYILTYLNHLDAEKFASMIVSNTYTSTLSEKQEDRFVILDLNLR